MRTAPRITRPISSSVEGRLHAEDQLPVKQHALHSSANWSAASSSRRSPVRPGTSPIGNRCPSSSDAPRGTGIVELAAELGEAPRFGHHDAIDLLTEVGQEEAQHMLPVRVSTVSAAGPSCRFRPWASSACRRHSVLATSRKRMLLVGEIAVKRRLRDAGGSGDRVDAGTFVAVASETRRAPGENLVEFPAPLDGRHRCVHDCLLIPT
jgi:hypothetical protein